MTQRALKEGQFSQELEEERGKLVPSFTHFLDLPALSLIIALGALKPDSWTLFATGSVIAIALSGALTYWIPRLYPWGGEQSVAISD